MYVSITLTDGLGNRFFQVAAMLWYAERTGRSPLFVREWITPDRHTAAQPITAYFPRIAVANHAPAGRWKTLRAPDAFAAPGTELLEAVDLRMSVRLEGWFQHVDFLPQRSVFRGALSLLDTASIPSEISYESAAFLHVRRGDYLHPACAHHRVDLMNYYALALTMFSDVPVIVVVSDDVEWARGNLPSLAPEKHWYFCDGNDYQTLAVMTRCGRGGIVANSTFSWWGAFFGNGVAEDRIYTMPGTWGLPPLPAEVALYPPWATVLPV